MSADQCNTNKQPTCTSVAEVKRLAENRWLEILSAAGFSSELLNGRGHPCPKCGGTDRFSAFRDVDLTGGVMCRQCFNEKNGDGFAAIMWLRNCSFPDAVAFVSDCVGLSAAAVVGPVKPTAENIVADVARAKRMPLDAFQQFGAKADRRGEAIVARVPVYDERGEVHSYFDLTPDGKGWFRRGRGSAGVFLPSRLPQAGETWLLVEGPKDAAALVGLGYLAVGLPRNEMDAKYARLFVDCVVIVVPDLDVPGSDGAQRTAGRLAGVAASVKIARLPGELVQSGGQDVRDVIARLGPDEVRIAVNEAAAWEPTEGDPPDERPEVLLSLNEAQVADLTVQALGRLGWETPWIHAGDADRVKLYQRGGVLVNVVADAATRTAGASLPSAVPQIRAVPQVIVRERITQAVQLIEETQQGDDLVRKPRRPPDWLTKAVHQRGDYGEAVRPLAGITQTPVLRPDGTVIQTPGWDPVTAILYRPDCKFPQVPDNPTRADAVRAMGELLEVLDDFPFRSDPDRSIWLVLVLTLLVRPAIDGPCPLFGFDANIRASGKTLLADVSGIIAGGSEMARKTWPRSDDEVRKTITAVALEGWPAILLDNVATTLGGPSLDAALTAVTWQDRVLGESRSTGLLPLRTVWIATGNNLELSADTARRTLLARLESPDEHPEDRTGFRHSDLKGWVREHRARLAVAGLTVLRAFFAAGKPDAGLTPWGSFEDWSQLIRGAIVFAGQADPCANRSLVRDADRSAELLRLIHAGIDESDVSGDGLTTAEMASMLSHHVGPDEVDGCPTLRVAIAELCGGKFDSRKIGYGLRRFKGRVYGGRRLDCRDGHGGVKRWFLARLDSVTVPSVSADDSAQAATMSDVRSSAADVEVF